MPLEKHQNMIDNGRAMIYLAFFVKFRRRNRLPTKPKASDNTFKINSLRPHQDCVSIRIGCD
jgi:hypothetical protein